MAEIGGMDKAAGLRPLLSELIEEHPLYLRYVGLVRESQEVVACAQQGFDWGDVCLFASNFQSLARLSASAATGTGPLTASLMCLRAGSVYIEALRENLFLLLVSAQGFENVAFLAEAARRVRAALGRGGL